MSREVGRLRRAGQVPKIVHKAAGFSANGDVSAKCYKRPRPINLKIATWSLEWSRVTCPRCLRDRMDG